MPDWFDTYRAEPTPSPRCSVRFDGDGTWSAWRGAILLASGLPTVTAACDAIDRAASARPPAAPITAVLHHPPDIHRGRNDESL